ncbi:MAG: septum formation initiator family protein [Candidatus Moranbacteria bacterium]|jgi:cell division protein FtsB|nr:septum formation initiator family protein [Candidatus Moranbacteria bacterium]
MKKAGIIISFGVVLGGLALVAMLFYPSYKEYERNKRINDEIEKLSQEADKLRENNSELSEKIEYFKTQAYKEKIAKEKLNLQKPDEQVVAIKPSISKTELADVATDKGENEGDKMNKVDLPNYQKWVNYFFGNL